MFGSSASPLSQQMIVLELVWEERLRIKGIAKNQE